MKNSKGKTNGMIVLIGLIILLGGYILLQGSSDEVTGNYYAYVANTEDGTISVIDTAIDEVVEVIKVDEKISDGLAANPVNGEIYSANYTGGILMIINGETAEVTRKVDLNRNLHGIDISPDGKFLYLTSGALEEGEEFNYIMIYDTEKQEVVKEVESNSKSPAHISFSKNGKLAFVSNVMSNDMSILDTEKQEIIKTIPVGKVPNEGKPSMDDKMLYVASLLDNVLSIVDLEKGEEVRRITAGRGTHGVAVAEDNQYVWTANRNSGDVTVIDLTKNEVIKRIETGEMPNHVFQVPNSNKMYISNLESSDIAVVDMNTYEIIKKIEVGSKPHEIVFLGK